MLIRANTQPVKTGQPHILRTIFNELAGESLQNYAFPPETDNVIYKYCTNRCFMPF